MDDSLISRRNRTARNAVLVLAGLYLLHVMGVLGYVASPERLTRTNVIGWIAFVGIVECLTCWAAACVRRGGPITGAVMLASLFAASSALSAVLAAESVIYEHPSFFVLQLVIFVWAVFTLALLTRAYSARINH